MERKSTKTGDRIIFTEMDVLMDFTAMIEREIFLRTRAASRSSIVKPASILFGALLAVLILSGLAQASWTKTSCPATGSIYSFVASGSNLFAGVLNGGIYATSDNGQSWTETDAGLPANSTVLSLLSNSSSLFAGTYGNGIFFSNNNGVSWTTVNTGLPTNATITSLVAIGSYIFAGTYGNGLYYSNTNGASWNVVTGLSSTLAINELATNGSSIFAVTQNTIYRSNDNGSTWTAINNGIPSNAVFNAIVANGSTLYAATNSNGIYYSTDNGTTWTTINNGLQGNLNVLSLTLNGSDVYAGTIGLVYYLASSATAWTLADTGLSSSNNVLALSVVNGAALLAGTSNGVWKITLPPIAPNSFVPANNTTDQPVSMVFSWNSVPLATTYGVQVSTDSTFTTSIAYNTSGITSTSLSINGLTNNTIYYWRVNAANAGGTSPWSSVNRFTTTLLSPSAIAPANNSMNLPVSLTLSWNPVATATTYGLQVSPDSTFSSSIIFSQSGLTSTSQAISGLTNYTIYYWRINATNAGGTSPWSGNSHFTTIVSIPAIPALVLPANNVAGQPVSISLSWYTVMSASSYALQISTDSTFATSIIYGQSNLTATAQSINGLSNNTTYYWRVNATNMAGTGPWSSVNHFTTILTTPTLVAPVTGTMNEPVAFTVSWSAVAAATSYGLQVASDSTFNTSLAISQTGLSATSQSISGLNNNTTYYWRVNATNAGGTSGWSAKNVFTTIVALPLTPSPLSPLNGATNQAVSLTLTWGLVANATSYALQISTDSTFASSVVYSQTGISTASQTVNGLANNTTYYWRISATNLAGSSPWSPVNNFGTIIAAPTLVAPVNAATGQPLAVTFSWDAVAHSAASYTLQVSTDSNFATSIFFNQSGITATTQAVNNMINNTVYYWRVAATCSGGTSPWSLKNHFTTAISGPTLISPANYASNQPVPLTLTWSAITSATSYSLQLSTDSTFSSSIVSSMTGLTTTSQSINGLNNNTTYYWRVSATNAGGTSMWSSVCNFTTVITTPSQVTPANLATGMPLSVTFGWNPINANATYTLQVSTDSTFLSATAMAYNQSGLTGTSQTVINLVNTTNYYWRINATYSGSTSQWSSKFRFTTVLIAPVLVAPVNNASNQPISITASWGAVPTATSYGLQVSTDSTFTTSLVYNQSGLTGLTQVVGGLINNTVYYWHVSASNSGSTSAWSTTNKFATVLLPPILSSPVNGSTNQATAVSLVWNAVSSATSYGLQVSTDSTFASVSFSQTGISTTSMTVSGLLNNSTYYWRVNSANSVSTGSWSLKYHFATIIGNSIAPTAIAPANGSTSQPITVVMSWNAVVNAASYGVQVSTDSTFSSSFALNKTGITTTTQSVTGLVNNTVYYWRVNASNAGSSSAWSTTSSFSTIMVAPTPSSPAMSSLNQPTSVTLVWNALPSAINYTVQLSTDSTFASANYNQTVTGTSQTVSSLANNITYYWRVNASGPTNSSNWSANYHFTTVVAATNSPILISPANGVTGQAIATTFSWNPVSGALSYAVQVSTDSTFSSALFYNQSGLTTASVALSGLANSTVYYWRVSATNVGGASSWSSPNRFTTKILAPTLVSPATNSANQPIALTLYWNPTASSVSYALQVSTDSTFASSAVFNQSGLTADSQALSSLSYNSTYYWRVNTTNSLGTSDWSAKNHFSTIINLPGVPTPTTPLNASLNQPLTLSLGWSAVAGAESYQLQVSTDSTFKTNLLYNMGYVATTTQVITGMTFNTKYFWRVSETCANGISAWSSVSSFFTTLAVPPLASPANGATNQPTSLKLSWGAVSSTSAVTYSLQISPDSTFATSVIYSQSAIATTSQTVNGLANSTVYYWRVCAANATGGTSAWSATGNFLTASPAPTPISPISSQTQALTFQWNPVVGATSYGVQVGTDSTFNSGMTFNQSGIAGTSVIAPNLASGTVYYWHVNATNVNGTSVWSPANMFTTVSAAPVLVAPINTATNTAVTLTLSWNAVKTASAYSLQVSTDSTFANPMMFNGTATSQAVSGLANSSTYFWRVDATNAGGISAWSARYQFTTIVAAPSTPKLGGSANNGSSSTVTLSLTWDSVANATSYSLQIAKDSLFATIVYSQTGLTTTSQTVTGLSTNATYYWRVDATNVGGTSAWSVANYFKLQSTAVRRSLNKEIPKAFDLTDAHYLKSSGVIKIDYAVPATAGRILIRLFDMQGHVIATLVDATAVPGYQTVSMNRKAASGRLMGSGMYVYRMEATGFAKAKAIFIP